MLSYSLNCFFDKDDIEYNGNNSLKFTLIFYGLILTLVILGLIIISEVIMFFVKKKSLKTK